MKRHDPHGLWKFANEFMIDYERRLFDILVGLGVLDEGSLAPWYSIEDVIPMYPPRLPDGTYDMRPPRPRLPFGECYEDEYRPPAPTPLPVGQTRDLIL